MPRLRSALAQKQEASSTPLEANEKTLHQALHEEPPAPEHPREHKGRPPRRPWRARPLPGSHPARTPSAHTHPPSFCQERKPLTGTRSERLARPKSGGPPPAGKAPVCLPPPAGDSPPRSTGRLLRIAAARPSACPSRRSGKGKPSPQGHLLPLPAPSPPPFLSPLMALWTAPFRRDFFTPPSKPPSNGTCTLPEPLSLSSRSGFHAWKLSPLRFQSAGSGRLLTDFLGSSSLLLHYFLGGSSG
jgi:hypothetical protein